MKLTYEQAFEDIKKGTQLSLESYPLTQENFDSKQLNELSLALLIKTNKVLKFRKKKDRQINFSSFNYVRFKEIGHLSGNDVLKALIGIMKDEHLCMAGNCLLFSADGVTLQFSICFVYEWQPLFVSYEEDGMVRYLYEKLFDESTCIRKHELKNKISNLYNKAKLAKLRVECISGFPTFMSRKINQTNQDYRHAFVGLLLHIADSLQYDNVRFKDDPVAALPIAACVKIAIIDNKKPEKLQEVFGLHNRDITFKECYKLKDSERKKCIRNKKAMLRAKAMTPIIQSAFSRKINDFYCSYDEISFVISEVRKFYQLPPIQDHVILPEDSQPHCSMTGTASKSSCSNPKTVSKPFHVNQNKKPPKDSPTRSRDVLPLSETCANGFSQKPSRIQKQKSKKGNVNPTNKAHSKNNKISNTNLNQNLNPNPMLGRNHNEFKSIVNPILILLLILSFIAACWPVHLYYMNNAKIP